MLVMGCSSVNSQNSKSNAVIAVQRQQLRGKFEVSEYLPNVRVTLLWN